MLSPYATPWAPAAAEADEGSYGAVPTLDEVCQRASDLAADLGRLRLRGQSHGRDAPTPAPAPAPDAASDDDADSGLDGAVLEQLRDHYGFEEQPDSPSQLPAADDDDDDAPPASPDEADEEQLSVDADGDDGIGTLAAPGELGNISDAEKSSLFDAMRRAAGSNEHALRAAAAFELWLSRPFPVSQDLYNYAVKLRDAGYLAVVANDFECHPKRGAAYGFSATDGGGVLNSLRGSFLGLEIVKMLFGISQGEAREFISGIHFWDDIAADKRQLQPLLAAHGACVFARLALQGLHANRNNEHLRVWFWGALPDLLAQLGFDPRFLCKTAGNSLSKSSRQHYTSCGKTVSLTEVGNLHEDPRIHRGERVFELTIHDFEGVDVVIWVSILPHPGAAGVGGNITNVLLFANALRLSLIREHAYGNEAVVASAPPIQFVNIEEELNLLEITQELRFPKRVELINALGKQFMESYRSVAVPTKATNRICIRPRNPSWAFSGDASRSIPVPNAWPDVGGLRKVKISAVRNYDKKKGSKEPVCAMCGLNSQKTRFKNWSTKKPICENCLMCVFEDSTGAKLQFCTFTYHPVELRGFTSINDFRCSNCSGASSRAKAASKTRKSNNQKRPAVASPAAAGSPPPPAPGPSGGASAAPKKRRSRNRTK